MRGSYQPSRGQSSPFAAEYRRRPPSIPPAAAVLLLGAGRRCVVVPLGGMGSGNEEPCVKTLANEVGYRASDPGRTAWMFWSSCG
jgi:hypothetical protein